MEFIERFITYDDDVNGNLYTLTLKDQNQKNVGRIDFIKRSESVEVAFIYVEDKYRRQGNATKLLTELVNRYTVEWNGRFTKVGRQFYENWNKRNQKPMNLR